MKAWDVLRGGGRIDTVFFHESMSNDEVRRALVDHDGFNPRITVRPSTGYGNKDGREHATRRSSPRQA